MLTVNFVRDFFSKRSANVVKRVPVDRTLSNYSVEPQTSARCQHCRQAKTGITPIDLRQDTLKLMVRCKEPPIALNDFEW